TWLNNNIPDSDVDIENYTVYRSDRTKNSGNSNGGGVCAYVNNKWCTVNNTHIIQRVCTPDLELLSLSLRPYYIPREFPKININVVYIPPDANRERATLQMTNIINDQQEKSPDSVILVTGDFNHHTLEKDLTNFHQYIDCPTRGINTLDLCYGKAYTCKQLAKLRESDHNMIHSANSK
ncbi:endonuclease domain of the non-LTR retrotransposon LINE-1, partial [Elysia marginata]